VFIGVHPWLKFFAPPRLCVKFDTAAQQHRPTGIILLILLVDSFVPTHSALRAFVFNKFLSLFPKQLKSVSTLARAARTKFAEPIRRRDAAIHEDVAAGDERAVSTHEECADRSYLVGSASASGRNA
jgi:hypothetical protein